MQKLAAWVHSYAATLYKREEGQTMAEYGVILAVIAVGILVAITALSGGITNALNKVTAVLNK